MTGPGLFAAQAEMLQKKAPCGVSDAWLDKKKEDFRQQQRKVTKTILVEECRYLWQRKYP